LCLHIVKVEREIILWNPLGESFRANFGSPDNLEKDHAKRVHIDTHRVNLIEEQLGCHVFVGATNGHSNIFNRFPRHAKITYFQRPIVIEQEVARLYVTMYVVQVVKVLQSVGCFEGNANAKLPAQWIASEKNLKEVAVLTKLGYY